MFDTVLELIASELLYADAKRLKVSCDPFVPIIIRIPITFDASKR
jgi:hypothetical protein